MTRGITPKARLYFVFGALALLAGLLLGRLEFVTLAVPPLLALVRHFTAERPPEIHAQVNVDPERLFVGDSLTLTVTLVAPVRVDEAEVAISIPAGIQVVESSTHQRLSLAAGREQERVIQLRATRWGAFRFGRLAVRTYGGGRIVAFEQAWALPAVARVYPAIEHLRAAADPPITQVFAGNYVSRRVGDGIEFAGIREFMPGDRMRRINWRVSSRSGDLMVNDFYQERNADIVLFVDTYVEAESGEATSLDLSVRGAASVAGRYLADKNRVGVVTFGGSVRWLTPGMGRSQTYRVLDYLLDVQVSTSSVWRNIDSLPMGSLPSLAHIVVFSPLIDKRTVSAILDMRARGFSVVVVDTLNEEAVIPEHTREGETAFRIWKLERMATRFELEGAAVPVASWDGTGPLAIALAELQWKQRARLGR